MSVVINECNKPNCRHVKNKDGTCKIKGREGNRQFVYKCVYPGCNQGKWKQKMCVAHFKLTNGKLVTEDVKSMTGTKANESCKISYWRSGLRMGLRLSQSKKDKARKNFEAPVVRIDPRLSR